MCRFDELLDTLENSLPSKRPVILRKDGQTYQAIDEIFTRIKRARGEFDALLFFAVCFGMLKSGKSTLVNLFAGRPEVSPTRFGLDTTLRPCLILAGDEDQISIFDIKAPRKMAADSNFERKCFHAVIDHLRGIIDDESELLAKHDVSVKKHRFSSDAIFKALCTKEGLNGEDPLITVVRLKESSELLKHDVALLDVPGIDSNQADIGRYISLLERCDLLLFIQSTVSALNHEATTLLQSLVERSKNSPIWLIQNRFQAQGWRNQSKLDEQDTKLVESTKRELAGDLRVESKHILAHQVNLGKAYDARLNRGDLADESDAAKLLNESRFPEVEKELIDRITESRLDIQLSNCLNQFDKSIKTGREDLRELELWLGKQIVALFEFRNEFDKLFKQIEGGHGVLPSLQIGDDSEGPADSVKNLISQKLAAWKDHFNATLDRWRSEITTDLVADDFNKVLKERFNTTFEYGMKSAFNLEGDFGTQLSDLFRSCIEGHQPFKVWLESCQTHLQDRNVDLMDAVYPLWKPELGACYLDVHPEKPSQVSGGRTLLLRKRKVSIDTVKEKIDETKKNLATAADIYAAKMQKEEIRKFFRQYRDNQLAMFFKDQLRARRESMEERAHKEKADLESCSESLKSVANCLDDLGKFCVDFSGKVGSHN